MHVAAPEGNLLVTSEGGSTELECSETSLVKIWDARGRGWRQPCSERTPNKTGEELPPDGDGVQFYTPLPPYPPSTIPVRVYPNFDHRGNLSTPTVTYPPPLVTAAEAGEAAGTPLLRCGAARGNIKCAAASPIARHRGQAPAPNIPLTF